MNSGNIVDIVLKVFQIIDILIGIICIISFDNKISIILVSILLFIIISLIALLYSKEKYIRFVDFLFDNEKHNFNLLPKMRMYLNKEKIYNRVKVKSVDVTYNITHTESEKSNSMGNAEILYTIAIENKSIPKEYYFITGNDYSDEVPQIFYKYGIMDEYSTVSPEERNCAFYYRNVVRKVNFNLDKKLIPQKDTLEIKIKVCYKNSFEFEHNYLDTIICLPRIFGDYVKQMRYTINLYKFQNDIAFHFFTYSILGNKLKYSISVIPNTCTKDNESYSVEFYPESTLDEKAYYFRIGNCDTDKESRF